MPTDTTIIDRLRAEADWFGSRKWGDTGLRQHGEAAAAVMRDAADALTAPPAAGAPPALVAKLHAWLAQGYTDNDTPLDGYGAEVIREVLAAWSPAPAPDTAPQMLNEDPVIAAKTRTVMQQIALNNMTTVEQCPGLLAFGPIYRALAAPAPVAPPAETCAAGHNYRRNAPPQDGDICYVCGVAVWRSGVAHHEGAPPAVAGGDAPEIQVGDWYQFLDCDVAEVIDERWLPIVRAHLAADELTELRGERDGQPFIWRRRQEGQ